MNLTKNNHARIIACLSLWGGLLTTGSLHAQSRTILDCPTSLGGDSTDRAFYIEQYPGSTLSSITLYMKTSGGGSTLLSYQVGINVNSGAYDGPPLDDFRFTSVELNNVERAVSIQFANVPVTPGSRVCFSFNINKQAGAPDLVYEVGTDGVPCPNVIETVGSNPPLSTFRREGVKLQVKGEPYLNVDGGSIQLAIDGASPGDTVLVDAGTYTENLALRSDVNVVGAGAGETILNGTGVGSVVTVSSVTNSEFSGFTVQGSGPDNSDTGIIIFGGSPLIKGNTVQNNNDGIRITNSSSAVICGNTVQDNGSDTNGFLDYGIIILGGSTPLVTNNIVLRNEVGVYLFPASTSGSQIVNNTVANNDGDGIWCNDSAPIIKNNLVTGNSPGISARNAGGIPQLTYNNVWDNRGFGNYNAQSGATITPGIGSISVDPLIGASFELLEGSPCIDAGDPAPIYNDIDTTRNDIGAGGGPCSVTGPTGAVTVGYLWTSVGTIPVSDISQSGAKAGLTTNRDRPFGGSPWLYAPFGVTETSVRYYAVRIGQWSGNTPPTDPSDYNYLDTPLSKVRYTVSGGMIEATNTAVGPFNIGSSPPVYTKTINSTSGYWAHENLRLVLNSPALENGRYDVRMEGFDLLGNPVILSGLTPKLTLVINNTRPVVRIDGVSFGGNPPFGECSIIDLPSPTSTLDFRYTASHSDGFLDDYSLVALVGRDRSGGTIVSDNYASNPSGTGVWNGVTNTLVAATPVSPANPLSELEPWESCAYQFRISAWARTTNGFGRIYKASFFDNYAIDLIEPVIPNPDLDGDGDVDAQDLAIFAAAYGNQ